MEPSDFYRHDLPMPEPTRWIDTSTIGKLRNLRVEIAVFTKTKTPC